MFKKNCEHNFASETSAFAEIFKQFDLKVNRVNFYVVKYREMNIKHDVKIVGKTIV